MCNQYIRIHTRTETHTQAHIPAFRVPRKAEPGPALGEVPALDTDTQSRRCCCGGTGLGVDPTPKS